MRVADRRRSITAWPQQPICPRLSCAAGRTAVPPPPRLSSAPARIHRPRRRSFVMRRFAIPFVALACLLVGMAGGRALTRAQEATPTLPQGAVGVTAAVLGAIPAAAAPGY